MIDATAQSMMTEFIVSAPATRSPSSTTIFKEATNYLLEQVEQIFVVDATQVDAKK